MGIITTVSEDIDEDEGVRRVFVVTSGNINTRSALNRVSSRASLGTGVGQRVLVAAAYKELGIDLVWSEGPFSSLAPEEKYEDAKRIDYKTMELEQIGIGSQITEMMPTYLKERVEFDEFHPRSTHLHMWEIPLDL